MGLVGSWFWISATRRDMKSLGSRPPVDAAELAAPLLALLPLLPLLLVGAVSYV
jgi:hypothetical protein